MYIAVDEMGNYVKADRANKQQKLSCPGCKERVMLKVGDIKQHHFAHHANASCHTLTENETANHLAGKLHLAQYLSSYGEVLIEAVLPTINQRPDILLRTKQQDIAIEYQCSAISQQRFDERNAGYQQLNIQVIWILGLTYFNRTLSQNTILKFMSLDGQLLFYLPDKKVFIHRGAFIKRDFERVRYTEISNREMFYAVKKVPIKPLVIEKQIYKLQNLLLQQRVDQKIVNYLYQNHRRVLCAPVWVHLGETFGLKVPNWQWRIITLCLLEKVGNMNIVQKIQLVDYLSKYVNGSNEFKVQQVNGLLKNLVKRQIISVKGDYVKVVKQLSWHESLQDKLDNVRKA